MPRVIVVACGQLLACWFLVGCTPSPPAARTSTAGTSAVNGSTGGAEGTPTKVVINADGTRDFDTSAAVAQSAELTRLLLRGSTAAALEQFAPTYREEIGSAALDALSGELQALLGSEVDRLIHIDSELEDIDPATQTQALRVRHLVEMVGGKQAISMVQFFIAADAQAVLRADLAAIDVRETWPSHSPATQALANDLIELLFGDDHPTAATSSLPPEDFLNNASKMFENLLHPDMLPFFEATELSALVSRVKQHCGGPIQEPHWSLWGYQTDGEELSAIGNIVCEQTQIEVRIDFSHNKLIGVSLIADAFAVSTLDLLSAPPDTETQGKLFWQHVFSQDLQAAHQLLGPAFQQELSYDQFELAIEHSALIGASPLKDIELDTLRFSSRLQRADPIAFAAYYVVTFEDGTQQAVQCEFGSRGTPPPLLSFTNDVQATLPSSDTTQLERIVTAFLSSDLSSDVNSDLDAVRQLLDAPGQQSFQPQVAKLFLRQLREVVGSQPPHFDSLRVLHVYRGSQRTDDLRAEIATSQQPIVFMGSLQAGKLKSFSFLHPQLETFAHAIEDFEPIEELGREFIRQWMDDNQLAQAVEKMIATSDASALRTQLAAQRDHMLEQYGRFFWSDLLSWQPIADSNGVSAVYELEFADRTLDVQLTLEISAIAAKVSSVRVLQTK